MLVPAILYKEEIIREFKKLYYTEDLFLESGWLGQSHPRIEDESSPGYFQYAIIDNSRLLGYLSYQVNYYTSTAYNFDLLSFDKGNIIVGRDVFNKLEELISIFHRVEWHMAGGNHSERSYDRFCKKHNGKKHILKDALKDVKGNYRDDVIYEIVKE